MTVQTVSLTELKQNMGDIVNRTAYGGERILLLSRGKERAALVSIEDLRRLEELDGPVEAEARRQRQLEKLDRAKELRKRLATEGKKTDSVETLAEIREERLNELTGLR